jgi:hypothetical protein
VSAAALASALGATPPSSAANSAGPGTGTAASPGISGPVVAGEGFAVHLEAQGAPTLGKASSVKVVLNAKAPFHCNDKYPYKFTPTANPSLTFSEAVARGMNIAPTEATMDVSFTPTQAGALTVSGELSFSVCTDDRCLVEKQALSVVVNVKGAS